MPTGYSYIYNPYMCLIYEAFEAITNSLMYTSAVAYSAKLSSTTTLATVQGFICGTYYGLGKFFFSTFLLSPRFILTISTCRSRCWQFSWRLLNEIVRHQRDVPYFWRCRFRRRDFVLFLQHFLHPTTPFECGEEREGDARKEDACGKPNDVCGEQGGLDNPVFALDDDAARRDEILHQIVSNSTRSI